MGNSVITGTGKYIPEIIIPNSDFLNIDFYDEKGEKFKAKGDIIIEKFKAITGIQERRYLAPHLVSSDMATIAAQRAIEDSGSNPEDLDYIIVGQNFGDIKSGTNQVDAVPSIAARIKQKLGIKNSNCVAYDVVFGCPGWIQAVIQADIYLKSGYAKKCLVIGTETLSRVVDKHDRDSMIYSDGAGAAIMEIRDTDRGILSHAAVSDTFEEASFLFYGQSFKPNSDPNISYIKMFGKKIYEYALNNVPNAMKFAFDKSGVDIKDLKKIIIHQANEKMDEAIIKRFYRLFKTEMPTNIMPMSINLLGNSSVATIPTLLDLILKNELENHTIQEGDVILMASVGAGMNINAFVYQF